MGMAAADAGDPGGEEHLLPAVPPLLGDSAVPPQLRHSPCGRKAASMEALVPVEGGEHGGSEDLIPAFLSLPSDRTEASPKPPSPRRLKAINMAAADRLQLGGIQDLLRASPTLLSNQMEEAHPMASMTATPNHLSLCNGSKEFDIDWGDYLANDARMLTMGGVSAGPLLVQGIECSTSQLASSSEPNHVDVEHQTNDVDGDQESEYSLADPFDNEEEYIGVDDENIYPDYVDEEQPEQPQEHRTPSKRKRPATVAEEQDVHDDEPIANYKRNRTTPTKTKSPVKKTTPAKKAAPEKKATPAKKATTGKKATPARKTTQMNKQAKGKEKKSPVKKKTPAKNGKKKEPEVVVPSISEAVLKPSLGTKRSLMYWLGG
ncbi:hypothetical protein ZWY2020_039079 [Hordeum vulgare]|nr:hypothetical protein ZWY2020_039079 [Hordeum vulgare]